MNCGVPACEARCLEGHNMAEWLLSPKFARQVRFSHTPARTQRELHAMCIARNLHCTQRALHTHSARKYSETA